MKTPMHVLSEYRTHYQAEAGRLLQSGRLDRCPGAKKPYRCSANTTALPRFISRFRVAPTIRLKPVASCSQAGFRGEVHLLPRRQEDYGQVRLPLHTR